MNNSEPPLKSFPIIDAIDHEILMHRDAHFGGLFSIMLDYYRQNGKGMNPEFAIHRIEYLAELEEQLKENIAAIFLSASESQKVADARDYYRKLRAIYAVVNPKTNIPHLIADLILSEDDEAEEEIASLIADKEHAVSSLIALLQHEELYDPLFPGYGKAPFLAAKALEKIGDKRAILSLFEAIGKGDFFTDSQIYTTLQHIGTPARTFLLRVLQGRPLNEDNTKAAIALIAFKDDEEVCEKCLEMMQCLDVQKDECLSTYLILVCAGLKQASQRTLFSTISQQSKLALNLCRDMQAIINEWNNPQSH